jgi:hypothetical protein
MLTLKSAPPYQPNSLTIGRIGFGSSDNVPMYLVAAIGDDSSETPLAFAAVAEIAFVGLLKRMYPQLAPHLPVLAAPPPLETGPITGQKISQLAESILQAILLPMIKGRQVQITALDDENANWNGKPGYVTDVGFTRESGVVLQLKVHEFPPDTDVRANLDQIE